jgi:hypothetical protein
MFSAVVAKPIFSVFKGKMSDEQFAKDAAQIQKDLQTLKFRLEQA